MRLLLLLLTLLPSAIAQEMAFTERLVRARYAMVVTEGEARNLDGEMLTAPREDLDARGAVQSALRKWKRYIVTNIPGQADLLFVVRSARPARAHMRLGPDPLGGKNERSADTGRRAPGGVTIGGEVASNADLLQVYSVEDGKPGQLLWRGVKKQGLTGTSPDLVQQYIKGVDELARKLGL